MRGDPFGLSGQVLEGQFRVEHPIGEGGFSLVYKGQHLGLNEAVAIKCLKLNAFPDTATIESFSRRFRDESRIAYRLSQGNLDIVRSITAGTAVAPATGALLPYMVLEWLDGTSLGVEFRQRRAQGMTGRPLDEIIDLFDPAATAIAYAHGQGIVHRDVKPGNLYLTRTRAGTRLKVLDFGLAKVLDDGIGFVPTAQTLGTTTIVCSFPYGAPEQFDPRIGPIGPWTDVYSFALLILEALRDKRVRSGEGLAQCAMQAISADFAMTCHALGIRVSPQVEVALARAVAMDPTTRPKNLGMFWEQLKIAMTGSGRRRASQPDARAGVDAAVATVWDPRGAAALDPAAPTPSAPVSLDSTAVMLDAPARPSKSAISSPARPMHSAPPVASPSHPMQSALPISSPPHPMQSAPPVSSPPRPMHYSSPVPSQPTLPLSSPRLVAPPQSPYASTAPLAVQSPFYAQRNAAAPPAPSIPPTQPVAPPPAPLPSMAAKPSGAPRVLAIVLGVVAILLAAGLLALRFMRHGHL